MGRILVVVSFLLAGCFASKPVDPIQVAKEVDAKNLYPASSQPGCMAMMHSYCDLLYSPEVSGNMKISRMQDPLFILLGQTNNDFSAAYFAYAKATLKGRKALPHDFETALDRQNYFDLLYEFMNRKPRSQMSLDERIHSSKMDADLDKSWDFALDETIMRRMESRFPRFHTLKEDSVPVELRMERERIRRKLLSDVSQAIWKHHPNWLRVQKDFEKLRKHFLEVIDRLDIPDPVRKTWSNRIASVRLVVPGSLPELADGGCSRTTENAYYYTDLNVLTVCAGDFNSEDILQTVAHELAHALDLERSRYVFEMQSQAGQHLLKLRDQVCETPPQKTFSCDSWNEFKSKFPAELAEMSNFVPELPDFQRCLKVRPTTKQITDADLDRWANSIVNDKLSDIASSGFFLRITKDKVPLGSDAKLRANPNYLNPCSYYLYTQKEEPIDDNLNTLAFFTAEYRCSSGLPEVRLKNSIEVARTMTTAVMKVVLQNEGEFSARDSLNLEGYSAPSNERFADVLGSYALADMLNDMPSILDRRSTFLASSSWQCKQPSLESKYPAESAVQQAYARDSHTDGDARIKEFFSGPVREVVSCQQDFQFNSCELPFRNPVRHPVEQKVTESEF